MLHEVDGTAIVKEYNDLDNKGSRYWGMVVSLFQRDPRLSIIMTDKNMICQTKVMSLSI